MKKIIWSFIVIVFLIISCVDFVYANNNGNTSGGTGGNDYNTCNGQCESSWRNHGIRFSLYKYNGTDLTYYGSVDYCSQSSYGCPSDDIAYQHTQKIGKVAYQHLDSYKTQLNSWSNSPFRIPMNSGMTFANHLSGETNAWNTVENQIINFFSFNTGDESTILSKIQTVFSPNANSLTISDIGMLYITVEPTINIRVLDSRYYGTAYEFASYFRNGNDLTRINNVIYRDVPQSIMAQTIRGKQDSYGFIGKMVQLIPTTKLNQSVYSSWRSQERIANAQTIVNSLEGYGINVFWLGNYVPALSCSISESSDKRTYTLSVFNSGGETVYYDIGGNANSLRHNVKNNKYNASFLDETIIGEVYNSSGNTVATCSLQRSVPTCKTTCSGKSGDDLLGCAENYCQYAANSSSDKKSCITSCGYQEPSFSSCDSDKLTDGDDTVCSASTTGSINSCTKATTSTYYKTTCTESSTIQYGNSLPTTLRPGTSFSYTPVLSGSKTCDMVFETAKWKFDYAASYTSTERTKLLGILQNFQKIDSTSIWYKDLNDTYKYDSSNADIKIEVSNSNNGKDTTTKTLEPNETINLLDDEIKVSSGGSVSVPLFNSGNKTTQTVFGVIKTNSSNKTSYRLPGVCIRSGDGVLYDVDSNGNCESRNDGPYYDYFTELKINEGIYDTETTVNKGSSNLDVSNTCTYSVDNGNDPVTCSIIRDPDNNNRYELRIENKNKVKVTYGLSTTRYELNGLTEYLVNSSNFKLYGVVADEDGNFLATCDNNGNNNNGENTCTTLFKAAEYDKIKDYCDANWLSDTANYSSASDCFNSCSYGNNTCKNNPDFDSSDEAAVERYCETNYLKDGYKNEASCLNDCLDLSRPDDEPCLGIACDYLYRPISLVDPFPNNRRPGYNWYGKEIYITDDLLNPVLNPGTPAEYVIELTPDRIDSIRSQTLRYNATNEGGNAYIDYVYENENKRDGAYESKFIHDNDIGGGGFYSFFTLIEGRGV